MIEFKNFENRNPEALIMEARIATMEGNDAEGQLTAYVSTLTEPEKLKKLVMWGHLPFSTNIPDLAYLAALVDTNLRNAVNPCSLLFSDKGRESFLRDLESNVDQRLLMQKVREVHGRIYGREGTGCDLETNCALAWLFQGGSITLEKLLEYRLDSCIPMSEMDEDMFCYLINHEENIKGKRAADKYLREIEVACSQIQSTTPPEAPLLRLVWGCPKDQHLYRVYRYLWETEPDLFRKTVVTLPRLVLPKEECASASAGAGAGASYYPPVITIPSNEAIEGMNPILALTQLEIWLSENSFKIPPELSIDFGDSSVIDKGDDKYKIKIIFSILESALETVITHNFPQWNKVKEGLFACMIKEGHCLHLGQLVNFKHFCETSFFSPYYNRTTQELILPHGSNQAKKIKRFSNFVFREEEKKPYHYHLGHGVYLGDAALAQQYANKTQMANKGIIPVRVQFSENSYIFVLKDCETDFERYTNIVEEIGNIYTAAYATIQPLLSQEITALVQVAHITNAVATSWVRQSAHRILCSKVGEDASLMGIASNTFRKHPCFLSFVGSDGDGLKDPSCVKIIDDVKDSADAFNAAYRYGSFSSKG